jgi:hypothetical protein
MPPWCAISCLKTFTEEIGLVEASPIQEEPLLSRDTFKYMLDKDEPKINVDGYNEVNNHWK